jgi:Holliday junction resolvase-like predicted endonuclease
MKGIVVEKLAHVLERAAKAVGHDHPQSCRNMTPTFFCDGSAYVIVARNWRSLRHRGELDLMDWGGDVPCFIEVKTRTTHDVKPAEAAVDEEKRHDLAAVAHDYRRRMAGEPATRFDVLGVYYDNGTRTPHITLFKNAFPMP